MAELEDLFWDVRGLSDPAARDAVIQRVRGDNPELADRLCELLHADQAAGPFMQLRNAAESADDVSSEECFVESSDVPALGHLGDYRLLRRIGAGGMGEVFLAEQQRPIRRDVAIKILRRGQQSEQFIARFEAERQLLAMMDHPCITRIFDAGTTDDQRPFLVMELASGERITTWCRRITVDRDTALNLFRDACSAVQHAHQRGVIHRDLKPSNVLVVSRDGQPQVRVIDFGVAKALAGGLTTSPAQTGLQEFVGTPNWCSPEQLSLGASKVDTRSDVYSLGLILYEIVAGRPVLDFATASNMTLEELRRHVCSVDPPPPGRVLREVEPSQDAQVAEHRRTFLSRELDAIVLRALEKDLELRYQSPGELSEDLRRLMAGDPVAACAHRFSYLVRKQLRRHRRYAIAGGLILASLLVGLAVASWQAIRANRAEVEAVENREAAEEQAQQLERILYAREMLSAWQQHRAGNSAFVSRTLKAHRPQSPEDSDLRGFEWYLLENQPDVRVTPLVNRSTRIESIAVSPNQDRVLVCDGSPTVTVLQPHEVRHVAEIETRHEAVFDGVFLDATTLATCGSGGTVQITQLRNTTDGGSDDHLEVAAADTIAVSDHRLLVLSRAAEPGVLLTGGDDQRLYRIDVAQRSAVPISGPLGRHIEACGSGPNGNILAGGASGVIWLIPADGGPARRTLTQTHRMEVLKDIDVLPQLNLCAVAQLGGAVSLLNCGGEPERLFSQLMPANLHSVALSPDGRWLACGDALGVIHLVPTGIDDLDGFTDSDVSRSRRMRSWEAHSGTVLSLRFIDQPSRSSPALVSGGRDGSVVVSDPFSPSSVRIPVPGTRHAAFADSILMVTNGSGVQSVAPDQTRVAATELTGVRTSEIQHCAESGRTYVCVDETRLLVREDGTRMHPPGEEWDELWQADAAERAIRFRVHGPSQRIAVLLENRNPQRHRIAVFTADAAEQVWSVPSRLANDLAFSPDGRRLAWVHDNDIRITDASSGAFIRDLQGHRDSVRGIAFSPDGEFLATVSNDRTLKLWETASGRELWTVTAHDNRAVALAFHPSLPTLATAGVDAVVRFWRLQRSDDPLLPRLVGEYPLAAARPVELGFSPDGRQLFVAHYESGVTLLTASAFPISGETP